MYKYIYLILLVFITACSKDKQTNIQLQNIVDSSEHYSNLENYPLAISWAEKYLDSFYNKDLNKNMNYHTMMQIIANSYKKTGKYKKAYYFSQLDSSYTHDTFGSDQVEHGKSLQRMASIFVSQNKTTQAHPYLLKMQSIGNKHRLNDAHFNGYSYMQFAIYYYVNQELDSASLNFSRATDIFESIDKIDSNRLREIYYYRAAINFKLNQFDLAKKNIFQSLDSYTDHSNAKQYLHHKILLASVYSNSFEYQKAEKLYKELTPVIKKTYGRNSIKYAKFLNNQATMFQSLGRHQEVLDYFKTIKSIYEENNFQNATYYSTLLGNLASAYYVDGQIDSALSTLNYSIEKKIQIFGEDHYSFLEGMISKASIYQYLGRFKEADSLYDISIEKQSALSNQNDFSYNTYLSYKVFNLIHQKHYDEASTILNKIDQRNRTSINSSELYNNILLSKSKIEFQKSNFKHSLLYLDSLLDNHLNSLQKYFFYLSEKDKESYYKTFRSDFKMYNSTALKQLMTDSSVTEKIYDFHIATKAIIFNSIKKIKSTILNSNDSVLIASYREWNRKKEQYLAFSNSQNLKNNSYFNTLSKEINDLENILASKSYALNNNQNLSEIKWKDIQKKLKKNEAAIEIIKVSGFGKTVCKNHIDTVYNFTDSIFYMALIITTTSKYPEVVVLPYGNLIEQQYYKEYLDILEDERFNILNKKESELKLSNLYDILWKPIYEKVADKSKIYLSLDGIYNNININTLYDSKKKQYVIESQDIFILTNTKEILTLGKQANSKNRNIVLFADPFLDNTIRGEQLSSMRSVTTHKKVLDKLIPLPETRKEIKLIADILSNNNWDTKSYLGNNASETKLKSLSSPKILHIATHGIFDRIEINNHSGYQSCLFLSNDMASTPTNDGILTSKETSNLFLDSTDLVVLSACQSGLGKIVEGEGVYGVQRSFRVAGAKTLVISLWNVSDKTTKELMSNFYKNYAQGMPIRKSLKTAQLTLKRKYHKPADWGAFIVVGN